MKNRHALWLMIFSLGLVLPVAAQDDAETSAGEGQETEEPLTTEERMSEAWRERRRAMQEEPVTGESALPTEGGMALDEDGLVVDLEEEGEGDATLPPPASGEALGWDYSSSEVSSSRIQAERALEEARRADVRAQQAKRRVDLLSRQLRQVRGQAQQQQRRTHEERRRYEYDWWETDYSDNRVYDLRSTGDTQQRYVDQSIQRAARLEQELERARRTADQAQASAEEARRRAQRYTQRLQETRGTQTGTVDPATLDIEIEAMRRELELMNRVNEPLEERLEPPAKATSPPQTRTDTGADTDIPDTTHQEGIDAVDPQ